MGQGEDTVEAFENGLTFSVSLTEGQKTGFFLDQREMRGLVKIYARERTVLNCFGYSGGFSVYAHAGQATRVDTIDTDEDALALAKANITRNGFAVDDANIYSQDVFSFLSQRTLPADYDFIILDPPAFAKRASDIKNASRGYRELNRLAIKHLKPGSLLLTASCSSHIDAALFQTIVFQAMKDAGRDGKIISTHVLAADHPISIYFPEGNYLKSLLLVVE
jgi:23S rRNA (cytosine1962-C5)-methyltransferase